MFIIMCFFFHEVPIKKRIISFMFFVLFFLSLVSSHSLSTSPNVFFSRQPSSNRPRFLEGHAIQIYAISFFLLPTFFQQSSTLWSCNATYSCLYTSALNPVVLFHLDVFILLILSTPFLVFQASLLLSFQFFSLFLASTVLVLFFLPCFSFLP